MTALVVNTWLRLERQERRRLDRAQARSSARLTYCSQDGQPVPPTGYLEDPRCIGCGQTAGQHLSTEQLCPEWALQLAWGR